MGCYQNQFVRPGHGEPALDDGRDIALGEVRKALRHGPQRPSSLAKRAGDDVDSAAVDAMLLTTAERRSSGVDALDAVRKIHASGPSGTGLFLPVSKVTLPPTTSDGADASPGRAGGVASVMSGYQDGPSDSAPKSGKSRPSRDEIDAPLRGRTDSQAALDDDKSGPLDAPTRAIKRALHPSRAKQFLR